MLEHLDIQKFSSRFNSAPFNVINCTGTGITTEIDGHRVICNVFSFSFSFSYGLRRVALQHSAGFQEALHLLYKIMLKHIMNKKTKRLITKVINNLITKYIYVCMYKK